MKVFRFALRATVALSWVLIGLSILALIFPLVSRLKRLEIKRRWSGILLRLCGVQVAHSGSPLMQGPALWVINHVSWLDIFAINQVRAAVFIAKSEIRRWPLLGWLVAGADTIFIERASRHAVQKVGRAMQDKFESGQVVGLFPEGTTSTGYDLLPFYANLFEPARRAAVPIQPVALLFFHHGRRSDFAAFVGEENLMQNLWRVLGGQGISIEVVFLPPIWSPEEPVVPTRAELGRRAHQVLREVVLRRSASGEIEPSTQAD
ncbi:lysophospholipid acyltransferase family protein [Zwartia vadi]|uniref:lysophospholipid acyltransferase family protein n=1 Tax=Zwartia vadi TaxID=3058168 RepID=UPI0025B40D83|nr:lysophospholipid acyltransferase family protein [Zwartia vadi]MDN3986199.1 lysophospholipid acyltransferase family protein [Zwartia vadi]